MSRARANFNNPKGGIIEFPEKNDFQSAKQYIALVKYLLNFTINIHQSG